jgi:hypothetical protein
MESQLDGRLGEMAVGLVEHAADEAALELAASVLEGDAASDHLIDQAAKKLPQRFPPVRACQSGESDVVLDLCRDAASRGSGPRRLYADS